MLEKRYVDDAEKREQIRPVYDDAPKHLADLHEISTGPLVDEIVNRVQPKDYSSTSSIWNTTANNQIEISSIAPHRNITGNQGNVSSMHRSPFFQMLSFAKKPDQTEALPLTTNAPINPQHPVMSRWDDIPLEDRRFESMMVKASDTLLSPRGVFQRIRQTPTHLRKAKLMFFYVRYPSPANLKNYFPDIQFNANIMAQLCKWFSNFREFYYIQIEKYARQALANGVKNLSDLIVSADSDLYRGLVLRYNRNNYIEVPEHFLQVVQATLREFFKSIQGGKDQNKSWKRSIYKIIAHLDDTVPEYFKSFIWMKSLADG